MDGFIEIKVCSKQNLYFYYWNTGHTKQNYLCTLKIEIANVCILHVSVINVLNYFLLSIKFLVNFVMYEVLFMDIRKKLMSLKIAHFKVSYIKSQLLFVFVPF